MKIKRSLKLSIIAERKAFLREVTQRVRRQAAPVILKHNTPISEQLLLHVRMERQKNQPISVLVSIYRPKSDTNKPHPNSDMFYARTKDLYKNDSFWIDANRDPTYQKGVEFRRVKKIDESRSYWEDLWMDEVRFSLGDLVGPKKFYRMFHTLS